MYVHYFDQKLIDFIASLELPTQAKFFSLVDLLETFHYELRMPYAKAMGKGLFELRVRGKQEVRIFYTFHRQQIFLLHAFIKKTISTPQNELRQAKKKQQLLEYR